MAKNKLNIAYIKENREEVLENYNKKHTRSTRPQLLTKKQRKALGLGKDLGKAKIDNVRVAPRKVNIVLDQIRGKSVSDAKAILLYTDKIAASHILKLLESATANAVNNNGLNYENLIVSECHVGKGVVFKRFLPRGKGSASPILKRSSNIRIVVRERD